MIVGVVTAGAREAAIDLVVRGRNRDERVVRAVIDTGFDGSLTLPAELVAELDLIRRGRQRGILADSREALLDVHEAVVVWDDQPRRVLASVVRGAPLVGMGLLQGYELTVHVIEGGTVRIARERA